MSEGARWPIQYQQPTGMAFGQWMSGDQRVGQLEMKVGNAHEMKEVI